MVEPVTTQNPGVYVARVVSETFVRAGENYFRLSDVHRSSLIENNGKGKPDGVDNENQGVPEKRGNPVSTLERRGYSGSFNPWVAGRPNRKQGPGTLLLYVGDY